jgi:hypothetical protein
MNVSTGLRKLLNCSRYQTPMLSLACNFRCRVTQRRLFAAARFSPVVPARGLGSPISAQTVSSVLGMQPVFAAGIPGVTRRSLVRVRRTGA